METILLQIETAATVSVITKITYLLFLFLILAIFIERFAEIFISIIKYTDLKLGWYKIWNRKAEKLKVRLDRIYGYQGSGADDKRKLYTWIMWYLITERPYIGGKDVIAAKSIRTRYYRVLTRIFALIISLLFAWWMYVYIKIDLVTILKNVAGFEINASYNLNQWFKIVVTAAILAAGSEPMHQLIKRVEKIGESKKMAKS